ncbi:HEAT repeat domain-containing protein [Cyanobium sp. Morenito 9A2]|uniref:HEAT repeat domain-containing protein n=1 Tax=Cyanobium sp. Morenito 9A2 TaxID=2823718 RepID=UPI0020CE3A52|nr:HEAT repeat domain-containing protein [Cyanobium sp. Morenito 9A2]
MIETLIREVREADSALSLLQTTRRLAAAAHPEAVPCLVEVLGFNNPGAAVAAVDGLIAIGEPAVEPLLANLDEHNYGARAWAVRALATIGDVRGLGLLEEALGQDIGPSVRRAAAKGLGQLKLSALPGDEAEALRQRCFSALEAAADDGEWVVRYGVIVGLEQLVLPLGTSGPWRQRAGQVLERLASATSEDTEVVRLRARVALERLKQP